MTLIIKPTGQCNFACTFCSAYNMDIKHPIDNHVQDEIKKFISELKPDNIIITGGEPLMVHPDYYYEIHDLCGCDVNITSNLKDFYLNPEKWAPLFSEEWFKITTSFNYGEGRRWDKNTIYTEDMFIDVIEKYHEYTGKHIYCFIAVIDINNEQKAIDHVLLAKKMDMVVKLNNALGVGKMDETFPRYRMFEIYLQIIDMGLDNYEVNCNERKMPKCPRNIDMNCYNSIRCCYVDNKHNLHVGLCDELVSLGYYLSDEQIFSSNNTRPNDYINDKCVYCDLFRLCNGCNINRKMAKLDPNYCSEMKKLSNRIKETGWML